MFSACIFGLGYRHKRAQWAARVQVEIDKATYKHHKRFRVEGAHYHVAEIGSPPKHSGAGDSSRYRDEDAAASAARGVGGHLSLDGACLASQGLPH